MIIKLPAGIEHFRESINENNQNNQLVSGIKLCIDSIDKDVVNAILWALNILSLNREGAIILIKSKFID